MEYFARLSKVGRLQTIAREKLLALLALGKDEL